VEELQEQLLSYERELDSQELEQRGKLGQQLSGRPLGGHAMNVTPSTPRSRLSGRITLIGHTPLPPTPNNTSTSTRC
jgi:hypothetical protein